MTDAEKAFEAAEKAIARVAAAGGTSLSLHGHEFEALEKLPDSVSTLTNLENLVLANNQVRNVTPLAGLTNLTSIDISITQITDITPLASLQNLQSFVMDYTNVGDIAPLASMPKLERLVFNTTANSDISALAGYPTLFQIWLGGELVGDLRPLLTLHSLAQHSSRDVRYGAMRAAMHDPQLAEFAKIDWAKKRTDKTLEYLRTLPVWPAPLVKTPSIFEVVEAEPTKFDLAASPNSSKAAQQVGDQISFLLSHAAVSQVQAEQLAEQIRFALRDVPAEPGSNQLPPALQAAADVATIFARIGNTDLSERNPNAEEYLRRLIAALEAQIGALTTQLANETKAKEAAEALAKANGVWTNA